MDGYFYLANKSVFRHEGHVYEDNKAAAIRPKDVSSDRAKLMQTMYGCGVKSGQIPRIMNMMDKDVYGSYLPKNIINMTEKMKRVEDMANGINASMSDAEKTLRELES